MLHARRSRMKLLLAMLALGVLHAASAHALTITSAKIQIELDHTTSVQLKGKLDDLVVTGAAVFHIDVDGLGTSITAGEFVPKGKKLRYQNPNATFGITEAILDPRHGKFTAKLVGLVLGGVHSPSVVEVSTDTASGCALVPVIDPKVGKKPPKKPKPLKLKVVKLKKGRSNACGIGAPIFAPGQKIVGDPPGTHASVSVAAAPTAGSLKLYEADAAGLPTGAPLCTLADDGQAGDAQAGDGTFGCALGFDTAAPTTRSVVATADVGGAQLRSSPAGFSVVGLPSAADLDTILTTQQLLKDTWEAKKAALGDGIAARLATVLALEGQPGVSGVGLSDNRGSIAITYASGIIGVISLEPKRYPGVPATTASASTQARSPVVVSPRAIREPPPDDAEVVGSHKVLVWDPGYFDGYPTEVYDFYQLYVNSTCPRFDVNYLHGADATVESLADLTSYGTVLVSTHGGLINHVFRGHHVFFNYFNTHAAAFNRADLQIRVASLLRHEIFVGIDSLGVGPGYIRALSGSFPNTIVLLGACNSGRDYRNNATGSLPHFGPAIDSLNEAFASKGVGAYFGFSRIVTGSYVIDVAKKMFPQILNEGRTTTQAFLDFTPKLDEEGIQDALADPTNPAKTVEEAIQRAAHLVMRPTDAKPIVYLKPTLTPEDAVIGANGKVDLKIEVEGADDCTLYYRWRNTGEFGHFTGGDDDRVITSPTIAYDAGDTAGTDTITLDVIDNGGQQPKIIFRLTTTIQVGCVACAEGTSGASCPKVEKCCKDGADNDADGKADCEDSDCSSAADCASCSASVPQPCPANTFTASTTCIRQSPYFDVSALPQTLSPGVSVKVKATATGLPFCSGFQIQNECIFATSIAPPDNDGDDPPFRPLGCAPDRTPYGIEFINNDPQPCDGDVLHTGCLRFDHLTEAYGPFWMAIPTIHLVRSATKPLDGTYVPGSLIPEGSNWRFTVIADALVRINP